MLRHIRPHSTTQFDGHICKDIDETKILMNIRSTMGLSETSLMEPSLLNLQKPRNVNIRKTYGEDMRLSEVTVYQNVEAFNK